MADQELTHRMARWLRALRGVAWTRHLVDAQGLELQALRRTLQSLEQSQAALTAQSAAGIERVSRSLEDVALRLDQALALREQIDAFNGALGGLQAHLHSTAESLAEGQRQLTAAFGETRGSLQRLEKRDELRMERSALPFLPRGGADDSAAWFYAAFEEIFRGPREQIRERLSVYVPDVRLVHVATGGKVVDIGCGRGEWLELMRAANIPATGVDENALMVEQCRKSALDAVQEDGVAYLNAVAEMTLAVVSAFHVMEHLSLARQLQFLVAARRALAPGGVLILETPNPENLLVGACTFYMDPTHVRPLPPGLLHFLLEAAEFEVAEVRRLHPNDDLARRAADEHWPAGVTEILCGPRDVGILARRPLH